MKNHNTIVLVILVACILLSISTAYATTQTDVVTSPKAASAIAGLQPSKHAGYNQNPVNGFAVEIKGTLYIGVQTSYPGAKLFAIKDKKEEVIYKAGYAVESLCAVDDTLYFLTCDSYSGDTKLMRYQDGELATLFKLSSGANGLTGYDGSLYYKDKGTLYSYAINKKQKAVVMSSVDEYVILNGVIYYANMADTASYKVNDPDGEYGPTTYKYGKLYGMKIGSSKGTRLTTFGVRELCATSDSVVFQNMSKSTYLYGDGGECILTGQLTVMPINGKASKTYPRVQTMFLTGASSGVIAYYPYKCSFISSGGKETALVGFGTMSAVAMPGKIYLNIAVDDEYTGYKVLAVDLKSFEKEKLFSYEVK